MENTQGRGVKLDSYHDLSLLRPREPFNLIELLFAHLSNEMRLPLFLQKKKNVLGTDEAIYVKVLY
jgi:hypothetical protein